MKLLGALRSPFVRMCLVTAKEAGLTDDQLSHQPVAINMAVATQELGPMAALGKIPVLYTQHGHHALYDSRVIMEYFCHVTGNDTLLPSEPVKRFRTLTLQALGQGMADAAVAARYETAERPKNLVWPELAARQEARIIAACVVLEAEWQKDLAEVSVGSIAVACALTYTDFRLGHLDWRKASPDLARWYTEFSQRRSMVATDPGSATA